jgi:hypothetical protein
MSDNSSSSSTTTTPSSVLKRCKTATKLGNNSMTSKSLTRRCSDLIRKRRKSIFSPVNYKQGK